MQFSVVAAALFAGAVMAQSTTYTTVEVTITQCASTVTNCPARSTVTSTSSFPVSVTSSSSSSTSIKPTIPLTTAPLTTAPLNTAYSSSSVSSLYHNTSMVAPTAYSTPAVVTVTLNSCPTTSGLSSGISTGVVSASASASMPAPGKNGTIVSTASTPTATTTPKFTGAASTVSGSFAVAGLAIAAFFL